MRMALVMRGITECSVCGLVLKPDDEIQAFPHFLGPDHPLWRFSDSAMHKSCYEQWGHHDEFEKICPRYGARPNRSELWDRLPTHLRLTIEEIKALPPEQRDKFWNEANAWITKDREADREKTERTPGSNELTEGA